MTENDNESGHSARVAFEVVNLPLQTPLTVGDFVLTPVDDIAERLARLKRFEAQSEVTAIGAFTLPAGTLVGQEYAGFWRPVRVLTLLLSFANRRHIDVIRPTLEVLTGGKWVERGWHSYLFSEGPTDGASWCVGQRALEQFLHRSFPMLINEQFTQESGLLLALAFYDQALREVTLEMQYLKTWIALEILVGHAPEGNEKILSGSRFNKLRNSLMESLVEQLPKGKHEAMTEKLTELNRPSMRRQVAEFCQRIFTEYPAQEVTDDEIQRFIAIRNQITHRGTMQVRGDWAYADTLDQERGRLRSLLERVVLALLDEHPNLMNFSWREYLAGA